jgi:hypothetical protein
MTVGYVALFKPILGAEATPISLRIDGPGWFKEDARRAFGEADF